MVDTPNNQTNIKVVARFRPQNGIELSKNGQIVAKFDEKDDKWCQIAAEESPTGPLEFVFDKVYQMDSSQGDVYDYCGRAIVEDVLEGYNGTIFAYGQTGAGKTHTMMGPSAPGLTGYCDDPEKKGMIPRIVEHIFETIQSADEHLEFTMRVSYIEIYMERIRDLLDPRKSNLQVKEDKASGRGVYVDDVSEMYVASIEEVFQLMKTGAATRAVASTNMNQASSRSHSIFIITITQRNEKTLEQKTGKLYLVDLAGSEKVSKTGAAGQQLEEAKLINKSLSCLGMVINSLTDGKSTHIPYRDSKLTRLLQDSLGGNARTTLIVNCSCSNYNEYETISTLRFGVRAKRIKNKPKINRELTVPELKLMLAKAEKEIERLRKHVALLENELKTATGGSVDLAALHKATGDSSVAIPTDGSAPPQAPVSGSMEEALREMEDRADAQQLELDQLREANDTMIDQLAEKKEELMVKDEEIKDLHRLLHDGGQKETSLHKENEILLNKLADTTYDFEKMQYDMKEKDILLESLQSQISVLDEKNTELMTSLNDVQTQLNNRASSSLSGDGLSGGKSGGDAASGASESDESAEESRQVLLDRIATLKNRVAELEVQSYKGNVATAASAAATTAAASTDAPAPAAGETPSTSPDDQATGESKPPAPASSEDVEELRKQLRAALDQNSQMEVMSNLLIQDLQNRCEKVVSLEMEVDELRDRARNTMTSNVERSLKKKVQFLERNLDSMSKSYHQQHNRCKQLEVDIRVLEKKFILRNDRIHGLEPQLREAHAKLRESNAKQIELEDDLKAERERTSELEEMLKNITGSAAIGSASPKTFGSTGSKNITRVLRGGRARTSSVDNPSATGLPAAAAAGIGQSPQVLKALSPPQSDRRPRGSSILGIFRSNSNASPASVGKSPQPAEGVEAPRVGASTTSSVAMVPLGASAESPKEPLGNAKLSKSEENDNSSNAES